MKNYGKKLWQVWGQVIRTGRTLTQVFQKECWVLWVQEERKGSFAQTEWVSFSSFSVFKASLQATQQKFACEQSIRCFESSFFKNRSVCDRFVWNKRWTSSFLKQVYDNVHAVGAPEQLRNQGSISSSTQRFRKVISLRTVTNARPRQRTRRCVKGNFTTLSVSQNTDLHATGPSGTEGPMRKNSFLFPCKKTFKLTLTWSFSDEIKYKSPPFASVPDTKGQTQEYNL